MPECLPASAILDCLIANNSRSLTPRLPLSKNLALCVVAVDLKAMPLKYLTEILTNNLLSVKVELKTTASRNGTRISMVRMNPVCGRGIGGMKKASELPAVFHEYISLVESLVGEGLVTKKCPLDRH